MARTVKLTIDKITADPDIQPRAAVPERGPDEYKILYESDVKLPPLVVYYDGTTYWLSEGFTRLAGARLAKLETVQCEVRKGTKRDAQKNALSSNSSQLGYPRTNEDKKRVVTTCLNDAEWSQMTDRQIAQLCSVAPQTVNNWRNKDNPKAKAKKKKAKKGDVQTEVLSNLDKEGADPLAESPAVNEAAADMIASGGGSVPAVEMDLPNPPEANGTGHGDAWEPEASQTENGQARMRADGLKALGVVIRALDTFGLFEPHRVALQAVKSDLEAASLVDANV